MGPESLDQHQNQIQLDIFFDKWLSDADVLNRFVNKWRVVWWDCDHKNATNPTNLAKVARAKAQVKATSRHPRKAAAAVRSSSFWSRLASPRPNC